MGSRGIVIFVVCAFLGLVGFAAIFPGVIFGLNEATLTASLERHLEDEYSVDVSAVDCAAVGEGYTCNARGRREGAQPDDLDGSFFEIEPADGSGCWEIVTRDGDLARTGGGECINFSDGISAPLI